MGKSTCSGVVISDHEALTAAHCIFIEKRPYLGPILVTGERGVTTVALARGAIIKLDLADIIGNFKHFKKAKASLIHSKLEIGEKYFTCGYPMGQDEQVCDEFVVKGNNFTFKWGIGSLIYGQSGGPVVNPRTNTVEGLNIYIYEQSVGVTPLTGIFGRYGIRRLDAGNKDHDKY